MSIPVSHYSEALALATSHAATLCFRDNLHSVMSIQVTHYMTTLVIATSMFQRQFNSVMSFLGIHYTENTCISDILCRTTYVSETTYIAWSPSQWHIVRRHLHYRHLVQDSMFQRQFTPCYVLPSDTLCRYSCISDILCSTIYVSER